jgi:transposase
MSTEQEGLFDQGEERYRGEDRIGQDSVCGQDDLQRKPRLKEINRKQLLLRPVDVEELVSVDHPVRAIWEMTGRLNLAEYLKNVQAVEGVAGRPAYDPRVLVSLWVYGYSMGVSSARELSRMCRSEAGCQWLSGLEEVNHHSLSDFRVAHGKALEGMFVEVLGLLSAEGLITLERVAHDGTKVRASAGSDTYRREKSIREHLALAQDQVERLAKEDEQEGQLRLKKARERAARESKERLEKALVELEKIREKKKDEQKKLEARVSQTDPESRIMKQPYGGFAPSYNVQVSTDAAAGIIVGIEATQDQTDYEQLVPGVNRIEENLGRKPKKIVVDEGYISRDNIIAMDNAKVDLIGSIENGSAQVEAQMKRRGVDEAFGPSAFRYEKERDVFICPEGKALRPEGREQRVGVIKYVYRARAQECQACPIKERCCPNANVKGRSVARQEEDRRVMAFREKMQQPEAKAIYRTRGQTVEFTNAWLKDKMKFRQFRLRGLVKANLEVLWVGLAHNIKYWIRLSWQPALAAA